MNQTQIIMQLVPLALWNAETDPSMAIKPFVEDALAIEIRLPKQVNMRSERMRYQLCCKRIQSAVSRMADETECQTLSPAYFNILRIIAESKPGELFRSRISTCFIPPALINDAISGTKELADQMGLSDDANIKKRISFLEKAGTQGAGIVELHDFLSLATEDLAGPIVQDSAVSDEILSPDNNLQMNEALSNEDLKSHLEILCQKIDEGLQLGEPVNFSNQPHPIITEALHSFAYRNDRNQSGEIKVIYMDGTAAEAFPAYSLECVQQTDNWDEILPVRASLISMRHLEMDDKVDFAWFRNRKVSTAAPFAETDAYCTATTLEMIQGLKDGENFHLHLYQTGLETAVVGFYRGLVKVLSQFRSRPHAPRIRVVPYYYDRGKESYQPGKAWV